MPVNLFCSSTSQRSYMTLRLKYPDVATRFDTCVKSCEDLGAR
jgi:hypothetical protein